MPTTWKPDPVIAELWAVKDAYAAEFDYDTDAMFDDLAARHKASGRAGIRLPPRRVVPHTPDGG